MTLQKAGGWAGLIAAASYVVGFALFLTLLAPTGYGRADADPAAIVAFLGDNAMLMYLWNLTIYVVNAVALVVLVLALHQRLTTGAPGLAAVSGAFGLIWGGLVLAAGMVANIGLGEVVALAETDAPGAAELWRILNAVENGLGGGNEIAGGLWVLLLGVAGLRAAALPRALCWLGIAIGAAGLATVVPGLSDAGGSVFGLGFIAWFAWAGVALLRG